MTPKALCDHIMRLHPDERLHAAAFPQVHGDFRHMVLQQFPYAVYYRPLDHSRLEIAPVLHQRQDTAVLGERGDV